MSRDRKTESNAVAMIGKLLMMFFACGVAPAFAALDLRNATVETLDNGLTLILLPDRHFPVVSVQALYRVGARDEVSGKTGLAHFLEHMAFRDSKNFPGSDLVSRIYAVGGEWHGYTWTDQTTYYATAPREHLDLLLRIEADRMQQLVIAKEDMEAERGAVLAEMHMYENSPTSMLIDAVNYTSFLAHPYRNNTIGWESDIENLQHSDVVEFYKRHYHPSNAVIAIVGDFDPQDVRRRVQKLFGSMPRKAATPLPHTIEPLQDGLRRVTLHGSADERQFAIAYRAPSANHVDFAPFLVLQEVLGTGSGVSFLQNILQNDWGTEVGAGAVLSGAAEALTTWYPPSAQDYVFIISGVAPEGDDESMVEQRIESRLATVREQAPSDAVLAKAKNDVQDALIFDVETTEDAAHQLAFFDGLHALDTLLSLPEQVAAVSSSDVQRVAATYLLPEQRSIAWYLPRKSADVANIAAPTTVTMAPVERPIDPPGGTPVAAAVTATLSGGTPVIVQRSDLSSTAQVRIVLPSDRIDGASWDDPIAGYSSLIETVRSGGIDDAIVQAGRKVEALKIVQDDSVDLSSNPYARMQQEFAARMQFGDEPLGDEVSPALIVVAGSVDVDDVLARLEQAFGASKYQRKQPAPARENSAEDRTVPIGTAVAQAELGYIVPAPGPRERRSDAYRLLLYILTHDYEGRLGRKAISESGLAYYIGSEYLSDGANAWITMSAGVDAHKIEPLQALLKAELQRLQSEPPTEAEVIDARNHMLGRLKSAAQSNAELARQLATQWLWHGEVLTVESLAARLDATSRQDVVDAVASFTSGSTIVVSE